MEEEEGQQERLQYLQRHITTQPCKENVSEDSKAAHSSENRTSPQWRPVWLQKRKRVYRCNLCTPTTVREGEIEYGRDLHLVFVDQEKAFDRVNRDKLWKVPEQYADIGQLLDNIRAIYANSRSAVRIASGTYDWFPVTSGVRQGCNLSPLLFGPYMDQITKKANPDPEALNELMFADDQAMMNNDKCSYRSTQISSMKGARHTAWRSAPARPRSWLSVRDQTNWISTSAEPNWNTPMNVQHGQHVHRNWKTRQRNRD